MLLKEIHLGDRLARAVSQAAAPAFHRARELTETALAAAPPTGPGVHNTIQVHVHLPPERQELDPQMLQDALAIHLRDAARRHGLV